ncbi:MAG: iron-sulfur cluster assembly accessory protein [Nitrospirota bacterium]|jgi:iron-sulfur cluster assembly protein
MVTVTPRAAERVLHSVQVSGGEGLALRIQVRRKEEGGSLSYNMGFDAPSADDQTFVSEGVTVIVDPESAPLAEDLVLHFEDHPEMPDGGEFVFMNPLDLPDGMTPE